MHPGVTSHVAVTFCCASALPPSPYARPQSYRRLKPSTTHTGSHKQPSAAHINSPQRLNAGLCLARLVAAIAATPQFIPCQHKTITKIVPHHHTRIYAWPSGSACSSMSSKHPQSSHLRPFQCDLMHCICLHCKLHLSLPHRLWNNCASTGVSIGMPK